MDDSFETFDNNDDAPGTPADAGTPPEPDFLPPEPPDFDAVLDIDASTDVFAGGPPPDAPYPPQGFDDAGLPIDAGLPPEPDALPPADIELPAEEAPMPPGIEIGIDTPAPPLPETGEQPVAPPLPPGVEAGDPGFSPVPDMGNEPTEDPAAAVIPADIELPAEDAPMPPGIETGTNEAAPPPPPGTETGSDAAAPPPPPGTEEVAHDPAHNPAGVPLSPPSSDASTPETDDSRDEESLPPPMPDDGPPSDTGDVVIPEDAESVPEAETDESQPTAEPCCSPATVSACCSMLGIDPAAGPTDENVTVNVHVVVNILEDQGADVTVHTSDLNSVLIEVDNGVPVIVDVAQPSGPSVPHVITDHDPARRTVRLSPVNQPVEQSPSAPAAPAVSSDLLDSLEISTETLEDAWSAVDHQAVTVAPPTPEPDLSFDQPDHDPTRPGQPGASVGASNDDSLISLPLSKVILLPLVLGLGVTASAGRHLGRD